MAPLQPHKGVVLKGWRYAAFLGTLVGSIGLALYPIIIEPMRNPEPWKAYSAAARKEALAKKNLTVEDIQPAHMKVWTDPYDRPGKPGNK